MKSHLERCPTCAGTGLKPHILTICNRCGGNGVVNTMFDDDTDPHVTLYERVKLGLFALGAGATLLIMAIAVIIVLRAAYRYFVV